MVTIDLHTHTRVSDGELSPGALVSLAAEIGLTVLGITDHDTTEGIPEAVAVAGGLGVTVVPGVELNCDIEIAGKSGHADILGYFIDIEDRKLRDLLETILAARDQRARTMVSRLQALGAAIDFEDVAALSGGGAVGRPHVAQALVASGFVPDVATAFHEYIGRDGPAYADRYRLAPVDACRVVRAAGGVPVLAHPVPPGDPWSDPKRLRHFLPPLVDAGLGGLECYYPGYTRRVNRWLGALSHHFGLVPSGGSDYHGAWRIENELGAVEVPPDTVDRLRQAAEAGR